jgi:hypothetical protein
MLDDPSTWLSYIINHECFFVETIVSRQSNGQPIVEFHHSLRMRAAAAQVSGSLSSGSPLIKQSPKSKTVTLSDGIEEGTLLEEAVVSTEGPGPTGPERCQKGRKMEKRTLERNSRTECQCSSKEDSADASVVPTVEIAFGSPASLSVTSVKANVGFRQRCSSQ